MSQDPYPSQPTPRSSAAPQPAGASPTGPSTTGSRDRRRPSWALLVVAALLAAVIGGMATLGLTQRPAGAAAGADQTATASRDETGTATGYPDWVALVEEVGPTVVAINVRTEAGTGAGSGVLLGAVGRVVTNNHVVGGAVEGGIVVTLADGRVYEATLRGTDPATDLAVVMLVDAPDDLAVAELGDSDDVRVGEPVAAIGNPLGLSNTVTTGVVSALDRPVTTLQEAASPGEDAVSATTNAIQVDAPVNPGNSGGPLFDADGRVIGINSSIATLPSESGGTSGSIGLGFAIPSDVVELVTTQLDEDGVAEHAYLGATLSDTIAELDGERRAGARIETVEPGSPAEEAGLRPGDVVVGVDDHPVTGAESLVGFVRQYPAGTEITLRVARDGDVEELPVTLAVREDEVP